MDQLLLSQAPRSATLGYDQAPAPARERRLHARAYRYWVSVCAGRRCPDIADLDARAITEFAPGSVLVELGRGEAPPRFHFIGSEIRAEAGLREPAPSFDDVPRASMFGQLVRLLPKVRDDGAPVTFTGDFDNRAGAPTHYRGVLLPFADADGEIRFVYAVIAWKLVVDMLGDAGLHAAIDAALMTLPSAPVCSPWDLPPADPAQPLPPAQQLAAARTWAALAMTDPARANAHRAAALAAAHDVLLSGEPLTTIAGGAALTGGSRIAQILELTFGLGRPRQERALHAAALAHAQRLGIGPGLLLPLIERRKDGIAGLARAEHAARRRARTGRRAIERPGGARRFKFTPIDADELLAVTRGGPRRIEELRIAG